MPKKVSNANVKVILRSAEKGDWAKWFPAVADWLCEATYDDGSPVEQVRLSLRRVGPAIVACLQSASGGGIRIEAQGDSPDAALTGLETVLSSPTPPWTLDPYPLGGKPRQRK